MPVRHSLSPSGEMMVQVFCPFPNWTVRFLLLSFESYLYIIHKSPLVALWLQIVSLSLYLVFSSSFNVLNVLYLFI